MQSSCNPCLPGESLSPPSRTGFVFYLIASALILNLFDAVFTMLHVTSGNATEANPLMAGVLANSPVLFVATKIGLVSLGLLLLWRLRYRATAVAGVVVTLATYVCINAYHIHGLLHTPQAM